MKPRPVRIENGYAYIKLSKGFEAKIDLCDVEKVSLYNWTAIKIKSKNKSFLYAVNRNKTYLHRFLLDAPKDKLVDHIDSDGLNNTRNNLRIATRSQNNQNRRCVGDRRCKGVYYEKNKNLSKRWFSSIRVKGNQIFLGRFETEDEAKSAYDKASLKYFKEFARTNEIT